MYEDTGFNFTETGTKQPIMNKDFKRQRQAYLAERNARKQQAQKMMKTNMGDDSSSDDEKAMKQVPVLIKQQDVGSNTDSSNSPKQSDFKQEREKYKRERMARKEEAIMNKMQEFGGSSSQEGEPIQIRPRNGRRPQLKIEKVPFKEEQSSPFGFVSMDLGASSARSISREGKCLLASVRLKDKNSDRKQTKERYEVEVPSKKGVNVWLQRWLLFTQNFIQLADRTIALYDINKVKLLFSPTPSGNLKIKLTLANEEQIFFAVNHKRANDLHFLDQYYFIFAKLITLKLQIMGKQPQPISRVKSGINQEILREARMASKIRKSSFFGGWQEKIGVVGNAGLALYKAGKDKPAFTVIAGGIRELWTRFEFQRENLVLKFMNGSSKVELSVPCEDFMGRENWLYQLYSLGPQ